MTSHGFPVTSLGSPVPSHCYSSSGAIALAEYIADTKCVNRIDLRENDIKTAGLMALSHALKVNLSMHRLDLDKETKKERVSPCYGYKNFRFRCASVPVSWVRR